MNKNSQKFQCQFHVEGLFFMNSASRYKKTSSENVTSCKVKNLFCLWEFVVNSLHLRKPKKVVLHIQSNIWSNIGEKYLCSNNHTSETKLERWLVISLIVCCIVDFWHLKTKDIGHLSRRKKFNSKISFNCFEPQF